MLTFQVSWAEMVKREEVSVVFHKKAGGMIRRLFGSDGLDETAIDDYQELYFQEYGRSVNRSVITETNEDMEEFDLPKILSALSRMKSSSKYS